MRFFIWILAALGALFLALVGAGLAGLATGMRQSDALLAEAEAYVDETIRAYGAAWDPRIVRARASQDLRAELSGAPGMLEAVSADFAAAFGPVARVDPVSCDDYYLTRSAGRGLRFLAECVAGGRTERADVQFSVNVEKSKDVWRLNGFYIDGVIDADPGEPGPRLVSYDAHDAHDAREPEARPAPAPALAPADGAVRRRPVIGVSVADRTISLSTPHAPTRSIGADISQAAGD